MDHLRDIRTTLRSGDALEARRRAAEVVRKLEGSSSASQDDRALALALLFEASLRSGEEKPVWQPIADAWLAARHASYGQDDPRVARTLNKIGTLLYYAGACTQAREYLEQSLAIR